MNERLSTDMISEYQEYKALVKSIAEGGVDIPCEFCGYNLRGTLGYEKQCPECGKLNRFHRDHSKLNHIHWREMIEGRSILSSALMIYLCLIPVIIVLYDTVTFCCCFPLTLISLLITISCHIPIARAAAGMPEKRYLLRRLPGGIINTISILIIELFVAIYASFFFFSEYGSFAGVGCISAFGILGLLTIYFRWYLPSKKLPGSQYTKCKHELAIRHAARIMTKRLHQRIRSLNKN